MKLNKIIVKNIEIPSYLQALSPLTQGFLSQIVEDEKMLNQLMSDSSFDIKEDNIIKTAEFLLDCKNRNEKIMICGDYDCDGIISTTLLYRLCQKLDLEVGYYIPNRLTQGYGAKPETIKAAYEKGYHTILFVDNGVKAHDALETCLQYNLKTCVIDHHTIDTEVHCDLLYHPTFLSKDYQSLCSSGQVIALMELMNLSDPYCEVLAAIATIGDMMNLTRYNRFIVKRGIQYLNQYNFKPITYLLKNKQLIWDEQVIAFQIVPVFNAIGRLADKGNVNQVVKYLLSDDEVSLKVFSFQLLDLNRLRKVMTTNHVQQALALINDDPFQIIVHDDFHEGIIGIVAGQLVATTHKPVMVLSEKEQILKGSVRSNGVDVYSFLQEFEQDYFLSFGGHAMACALSLRKEDLVSFSKSVQEKFNTTVFEEPQMDVLIFENQDYQTRYYQELMSFRPYGQGFNLLNIYLEVIVVMVSPLGQSGYKLTILPVGDITEVLYFKKDVIFDQSTQKLGIVGNLSLGYQKQLQVVCQQIIIL